MNTWQMAFNTWNKSREGYISLTWPPNSKKQAALHNLQHIGVLLDIRFPSSPILSEPQFKHSPATCIQDDGELVFRA